MTKKKQSKEKPTGNLLIKYLLGGTLNHYGNEFSGKRKGILSWLLLRYFNRIEFDPEKVEKLRYYAEKGRLVYALPYRSPLDFFFFYLRLRFSGLPTPEIAYNMNVFRFQPFWKLIKIALSRILYYANYGSWPNPYRNKYYLERYREGAGFVLSIEDRVSFIKRIVYPIHDPIYHLIKLHKKHGETVIIVPIFTVFEKSPDKKTKNAWDIFTGPKNRPGRLRKFVQYARHSQQAFVEVCDPITIGMFLEREDQKGLTDEAVAFNLRKELWEHASREMRVIKGPKLKPRTQIMETVLRDPEVVKVMRKESKARQKSFRDIRKEAAQDIDEIASNYSQSSIEILDKVLTWVWDNLYDGVIVDKEGIARLKETMKRYPVIFVPSHKSHIDYLVLSYVLYYHNMICPHIVAGENLDTWPIGTLLRKAGAFFMRRSFKDDPLYKVVFTKYVEVLIREGYNIEFFIEGGRSRTGRLLMPTMGMVKYIIKAYENKAANDIMFVPVYIGYEQILEEGEYLEEIHGVKNPKGNLFEMIRNVNLLKKRYGRIYVNFGEEISLGKHLKSVSETDAEDESRPELITHLAGDIIQGINKNQVVTSFALMAAALLTSPAKAITRSELLNALALLFQYLISVDAKFAETLNDFNKAVEDVIIFYKQRKLISIEEDDETGDHMYSLPEDQRVSLEMYKNMILHHFLPMNYVTMSLLSASYGDCEESKVFEDYNLFKDLFKVEFIDDSTQSDEEKIEHCINFLVNGRQIKISDEDGHRHFKVTKKGREEMVYFAAMLTNFLESYGIVLNTIPSLHKKPENQKEFLARLKKAGNRRFKQGTVLRKEALSQLLFKNAIKYAQDKEMIILVQGEAKYPLLTANRDTDDQRNQLLSMISKFIRVEKYHYLDK